MNQRSLLGFTALMVSAAISLCISIVSVAYLVGHLLTLLNLLYALSILVTSMWPIGIPFIILLFFLFVVVTLSGITLLQPIAVILTIASALRWFTELPSLICVAISAAISFPLLFGIVYLVKARAQKTASPEQAV